MYYAFFKNLYAVSLPKERFSNRLNNQMQPRSAVQYCNIDADPSKTLPFPPYSEARNETGIPSSTLNS
jgi:hypothetical protein